MQDNSILERVRHRLSNQDISIGELANPLRAKSLIAAAVNQEGIIASPMQIAQLVRDLSDHLLGLGQLEQLLREPGVTDVMVNGPSEVWIEKDGQLILTDMTYANADILVRSVRRVVGSRGHRLDTAQPWVDAQLADGSRLHALIDPIALDGPLITLRKFSPSTFSLQDLYEVGAVSEEALSILENAINERKSIVVCGRTGSGKTTLLQALLGLIDDTERLVLIEDAPEIRAQMPHIVRMKTRRANAEGGGEVSIANLVRQSLRMRPDRIIIGEVRGEEIADVLQALITGHEGCMTTVHAASSAQALIRLEGMALLAGLPTEAVRSQISSAIDLVVVCSRGPSGKRGVVEIAEISGGKSGVDPTTKTVWERTSW